MSSSVKSRGFTPRAGKRRIIAADAFHEAAGRWCSMNSTGRAADPRPVMVTEAEIVAFGEPDDIPQWFHTDPVRAAEGRWGGLIASGWHTCAIGMRLVVDGVLRGSQLFGSPGLDHVKWLAPVRPGDALTMHADVLDARMLRAQCCVGHPALAVAYREPGRRRRARSGCDEPVRPCAAPRRALAPNGCRHAMNDVRNSELDVWPRGAGTSGFRSRPTPARRCTGASSSASSTTATGATSASRPRSRTPATSSAPSSASAR